MNGGVRPDLPADESLDNAGRDFSIDVTGHTVAGENRVELVAFDSPEGAFFRISNVSLHIDGFDLPCEPAPPPPADVVDHPAPAGVSAFAGLAPDFPRDGLLEILGGLARPFTAVLLDFGPVYTRWDVQMFAAGAVGRRAPNPAHLAALSGFVEALIDGTPDAVERHLQLFLLNGSGVRRAGYDRAYPGHGPRELDEALRGDGAIRAELGGYLAALTATLAPYRDRVRFRLVVGLEDNYTRDAALAVRALALDAGWPDPIGRNPCGCGFGDTARIGDFHEGHLHGAGSVAALPGGLRPPDSFSNDGWGWTLPAGGGPVGDADVVAMARKASETRLWLHLWVGSIQGYPIPAAGPRALRFDVPPAHLLALLGQGLAGDE